MKKRILLFALSVVMLLGSFAGINNFATAYAESTDKPKHVHTIKSKYSVEPTEAKNGIMCYYCTGNNCDYFYEEEVSRLPDVYVHKYRHSEEGLRMRITVAQNYSVVNGKVDISMENWFASQAKDKYLYQWEGENIKGRSLEFKAKDLGIGSFDTKATEYKLTVPVNAITNCDENGNVVVYLTTGAAMLRLSESATAALVAQAKDSIGVYVKSSGNEIVADILVDGESVAAPDGVEMLYWVKDAGDKDTISKDVANSEKYMNFALEGDFDLIYVESLSA